MTTIDLTRIVTGAVLREMRGASGLSLRGMAERAGCSRQHLARVESGERALTRDIGRGISRAIAGPHHRDACSQAPDPPHKTAGVRSLTDGVDAAPSDLFVGEQYFPTLTLACTIRVTLTDAMSELTSDSTLTARPSIQRASC
jgi:hypothetical protein